MSTVGYGDFSASTTIGRVLVILIIVLGILLFADKTSEVRHVDKELFTIDLNPNIPIAHRSHSRRQVESSKVSQETKREVSPRHWRSFHQCIERFSQRDVSRRSHEESHRSKSPNMYLA